MREYIYWHNELFGVLLNDEEYAAMTVNDLKQAIENSDRTIVQKPDGEFDMIDLQANEYILAEYPEDTQPDELPE